MNGLDLSCVAPPRKYYQQLVVINKVDIEDIEKILPTEEEGCAYRVKFNLKPGTTGYRISGATGGSSFFGSVDKSISDLGYPQYIHNASMLMAGLSEEAKCIMDSLGKGQFVAAYQLTDGTVEIYGIDNGLTAGDYTYDIQGGGGGTPIVLSSSEDAPEPLLPLIYESAVPGAEGADFDSAFENPLT